MRRDMVSHFVLRLAYCRTDELRRWLVTQESVLFRHRFNRLLPSDKVKFMAEHSLSNTPLSAAEFSEVKDALYTVLQSQHSKETANGLINDGAAAFYSVPFELVPELVRSRRCYLRRGRAFVHRDALSALVVGAFKTQLAAALSVTARKWSSQFAGEEAERVAPVVDALSTRYLGAEYGRGGDGGAGVSLAELDAAAAASFPLCMRNLYGHLKDAHHLRHAGRMQLGLFLKGIGLQLDEAMAFWRTEFCKKIPGEQFEKQYAYAIRHNYGREGKRADYTPYSCMKVITSTPGTGEHHGCPYRTFSEENLRAALRGMRLAAPAVAEVLDKVRGKHYQLACGAAFAGVHGCECEAGVQHPNQYFSESRKALGLDKPKAGAAGAPGSPASPGGPMLSTPAAAVKTSQAGPSPPSARA